MYIKPPTTCKLCEDGSIYLAWEMQYSVQITPKWVNHGPFGKVDESTDLFTELTNRFGEDKCTSSS